MHSMLGFVTSIWNMPCLANLGWAVDGGKWIDAISVS